MKNKTLSGSSKGFSLVELLVVIAVIGIIAAIAIPNIANITSQASVAKNQRNAQNVASVASAALAAGYTNTSTWGSATAVIDALSASNGRGVTVGTAPNVLSFGITPITDSAEKTAIAAYLTTSAGSATAPATVLYNSSPTNGGTN